MSVAMFRDSDLAHKHFEWRCLVVLEVKVVAVGCFENLKKKPPSFCQTLFPWNLGAGKNKSWEMKFPITGLLLTWRPLLMMLLSFLRMIAEMTLTRSRRPDAILRI
jgi:hypothetical protein